jgi:hypothetical protein
MKTIIAEIQAILGSKKEEFSLNVLFFPSGMCTYNSDAYIKVDSGWTTW